VGLSGQERPDSVDLGDENLLGQKAGAVAVAEKNELEEVWREALAAGELVEADA
jgi:hypothetical protein